MSLSNVFQNQALSSDDLDLLQRVLKAWCSEQAVDIEDPQASRIAIELFDWHQFGLRSETELLDMVRSTYGLSGNETTLN